MKCPVCKRPVNEEDRWSPFCSERCKLIDLGNWASEKYVIPAPLEPEDQAAADEPEHPNGKPS